MGMVISLGAGLVVGIMLLVWGLRERSAKHEAQLRLTKVREELARTKTSVSVWQTRHRLAEDAAERAQKQICMLHSTINSLHEQLASCKDPSAVKALLDKELGEQV